VFDAKVNNKAITAEIVAERAKEASATAAAAAQNAAAAAQTAAQTAAAAAQTAAQEVSNAAQVAATNVSKGVYSARVWAAPRLETAADYTTSTVAPAVSGALRSTARQIRPEDVRQKRSSSALTWSFLAAAVLAAGGAVAVIIRQRYRTAMAADTEEEAAAGTTGASPAGDGSGSSTDAGVNGRVSAPGR
jgi:hypothetical protein